MQKYLRRPEARKKHMARVAVNKKADRDWLTAYKTGKPCADCGHTYPPIVMDFDHREGAQKKGGVSDLVRRGRKQVLQEIAKCDLVCANCHRLRTWRRRQKKVCGE